MPGQYSNHCRSRPCARLSCAPLPTAAATARLFLCARCQDQVVVCSHCDRGQIYCAQGCAQTARRDAQRAAGRRYQNSRRGRVNHAARAGRYRARQNNVTHQGSPPQRADDLVTASAVVMASKPPSASPCDVARRSPPHRSGSWCCHWCGCRCPPFVRREFLRRRTGRSAARPRLRRTA
jgi:hypothetical protein